MNRRMNAGFKLTNWFSLLSLLMVAAISGANAQENPAVAESRLLIYNEQPKKALEVITKASAASPKDAALLYQLGRVQMANGDVTNAEITFQKGLDTNAKEALNLVGKGQLRMLENKSAEAKTLFEQAIAQTKSKNAAVLRAVGEGYLMNEKNYNDAVNTLLKAKALGEDPQTYMLLGDAYAKLAKGGDAVSAYERAGSLDPKNGYAHYKVGTVYLRSKNTAVAEEALQKAISIDPNTALAHKELGQLYYIKNVPAKAVKETEAYVALTEKKDEAKASLAFMYFLAKDYAKSSELFKELIEKPNVTATTLKYYFYSLVEGGKLEEATAAYNQYLAKAKAEEITADFYVYAGKMFQKKSAASANPKEVTADDSLAIVAFKQSLALEPNAEIAAIVAETYFDKFKAYDQAIIAYDTLKSIKEGKLGAKDLYNVGRAYYVERQFVEADSAFANLIVLQPKLIQAYSWRGKTEAALDSVAPLKFAAKPYFEKVIELNAATPDKNKAEVINALEYLGYYYSEKDNAALAKQTFEKIKAIDPSNEKANAYLKALQQNAAAAQKKKQGQ